MIKNLTNIEIYNYAQYLGKAFSNTELVFPVKVHYYIQKNIKTLLAISKEIEEMRITIIKKYGEHTIDETTGEEVYSIPEEKISIANAELDDFLNENQEVQLNILKLDWFENIQLSAEQVQAISFMIEE